MRLSLEIHIASMRKSHSEMSHIPSVLFTGSAFIHARCGEIGINIMHEWRGRIAHTPHCYSVRKPTWQAAADHDSVLESARSHPTLLYIEVDGRNLYRAIFSLVKPPRHSFFL